MTKAEMLDVLRNIRNMSLNAYNATHPETAKSLSKSIHDETVEAMLALDPRALNLAAEGEGRNDWRKGTATLTQSEWMRIYDE